jgi:hypothetical protein
MSGKSIKKAVHHILPKCLLPYWKTTILREKQRLRTHGNRVLGSIFVPKREKIMGDWRQSHSEDIHDLYS